MLIEALERVRVEAAARGLAVRPLCFHKYGKPRYWRTRIDPLEQVWSEMCVSLEADPDQTSKELLAEFQARYPSNYDRQLRTLQRRVQAWRKQAAFDVVARIELNESVRSTPAIVGRALSLSLHVRAVERLWAFAE